MRKIKKHSKALKKPYIYPKKSNKATKKMNKLTCSHKNPRMMNQIKC